MAEIFASITGPRNPWIVVQHGALAEIMLVAPISVRYFGDAVVDTFSPVIVAGGTTFVVTDAVYCPYTVPHSGVISLIAEHDLPSYIQGHDIAVLQRIGVHDVWHWQGAYSDVGA